MVTLEVACTLWGVNVKVALVAPAGIVTFDGTVASELRASCAAHKMLMQGMLSAHGCIWRACPLLSLGTETLPTHLAYREEKPVP
jgi:hypothetical protein